MRLYFLKQTDPKRSPDRIAGSLVRAPSAILLAGLCATAAGQHRGGLIRVSGAPNGADPGVSARLTSPLVHPFVTSDLTFAQLLGATVSGTSVNSLAFWGSFTNSYGLRGQPGFPGPNPFVSPFIADLTFAQRLGATVSGSPVNSLPFWNPRQSMVGRNGWYGLPEFGFSPAPYPVLGAGSYAPNDYPRQGSQLMTVRPPQYPVQSPGMHRQDTSLPARSSVHVYQAPSRETAQQSEYSSVIALKNGCLYTTTTYWMEGRTLHFVTTQGEHMQVPFPLLDRLYGHQGHRQNANTKLPISDR
jgi:hypothetical protein